MTSYKFFLGRFRGKIRESCIHAKWMEVKPPYRRSILRSIELWIYILCTLSFEVSLLLPPKKPIFGKNTGRKIFHFHANNESLWASTLLFYNINLFIYFPLVVKVPFISIDFKGIINKLSAWLATKWKIYIRINRALIKGPARRKFKWKSEFDNPWITEKTFTHQSHSHLTRNEASLICLQASSWLREWEQKRKINEILSSKQLIN